VRKRVRYVLVIAVLCLLFTCVPFGLNATPVPEAGVATVYAAPADEYPPSGQCDWYPLRYSVEAKCCWFTKYGGAFCVTQSYKSPCPYCKCNGGGTLSACGVKDNETLKWIPGVWK